MQAQVRREGPLAWASRFCGFGDCINGSATRRLFIIDESDLSFNQLVLLWNIRARDPVYGDGSQFIGIPSRCLEDERLREVITEWLETPPFDTKPDLQVDATEATRERAERALRHAGLKYVDTGGRWTSYSKVPEERRDPEFAFARASIPQRIRRGLTTVALVGLREGPNPVHVPVPQELPRTTAWHGLVRVVVMRHRSRSPLLIRWRDSAGQRVLPCRERSWGVWRFPRGSSYEPDHPTRRDPASPAHVKRGDAGRTLRRRTDRYRTARPASERA